MRRRVAFITGSRAEYGLLRTALQAAFAHPSLRPDLVVTGMHLLRQFGHTIDDVLHDGWTIAARVSMYKGRATQARALADGVAGIAAALQRLDSEIVVVLGDRLEALAGALAASTTDRFLAHIHGGDVAPGHLDDAFRHAITKLAHLHLTASEDAARRVRRLGERPDCVRVVGAPGLDDLRCVADPPAGWMAQRFDLDPSRPVALVLHHPVGRSEQTERRTMSNILRAVLDCDLSGVVLYPNNDPGHGGIIEAIGRLKSRGARGGRWAVLRSLPRREFLEALLAARVLVGNSSCGHIEAHSAGTPAVDVGPRQSGRLSNRGSVLHCGETRTSIAAAVRRACRLRLARGAGSTYGDGRAGVRIAAALAGFSTSDKRRRKQIVY